VPDLDRFRPILWAATLVCLVAGVVAIPVVGPDEGDGEDTPSALTAAALGGEGTTTTVATGIDTCAPPGPVCDGGDPPPSSAPPSGTSATGAAHVPATSAAAPTTSGAPTTTTTATPVEEVGRASDPGPATPSRAGTYRYKVSTSDGKTSEATTQVEDKGTADGETRQLVRLRGQGFDSDNDVAWRADGVYVGVSNLQYGQSHFTCDWNPDALQLRLPLAAGTTWESTSSCTFTIGATPVTVVRTSTGKVVELRRVKIAGRVVDVWAIDGTEHVEFAGNVVEGSGTSLFSPKHGLVVRSDSTIKGQGSATMEIENLDPE
jgi:hypothetical protein